jgi:hypothetical protein
MEDLIKALTLLLPYFDDNSYSSRNPTHCEHDVLCLFPDREPPEEIKSQVEELGFGYGEHEVAGNKPCFYSYRFGSC